MPEEKKGQAVVKSIGPGSLYPGAGKEARRTDKEIFCGTMTGVAYGVNQKPNVKDPTRISTTFLGSFIAVTKAGDVIKPMEIYVPSMVEGTMVAMLQKSESIHFAYDVYAVPTEKSPLGYAYEVRDRLAAKRIDPALELAYEAGILERPQATIEGSKPERIDPGTGEVQGGEAVTSKTSKK